MFRLLVEYADGGVDVLDAESYEDSEDGFSLIARASKAEFMATGVIETQIYRQNTKAITIMDAERAQRFADSGD